MEILLLSESGAAGVAKRAAQVAAEGKVALFPAERLYGLMADATNAEAVQRVFALKGRATGSAVPVLFGSAEQAEEWVEIPESARPLIERFWPGPLTLVLELKRSLPAPVTGGSGKLGARVPGNEEARLFANEFGGPLTATSANRSGEPPARTVLQALRSLAGEIGLVVDAGELPGPPASTVAEIRGDSIYIIRHGAIGADGIKTYWKGPIIA